jgi:HAD superfamily hydrolase (TIGR01490 family)
MSRCLSRPKCAARSFHTKREANARATIPYLPQPHQRLAEEPYGTGGIISPMVESKPPAKEPLAVFDVDGTLFRRGLLPALTRRLVNEGVFSERVREELSRDYYAWVERRGSYDTYDRLVMELFLRELKGVSVVQLQRCARAEVEAHGRRLHMYTRDMARRLQQTGYQLIAISGSPQEILDLFLKPLGFDRSWGTVLAQDAQRCYTGDVLHDPFKNKRQVLEKFLEDADVGLGGSVGMGDTLSDVGFLSLVQTPIAFNPNRSLFEVAQQRGWPIVIERKDVIYNLQTPLKDPVLKDDAVWVG